MQIIFFRNTYNMNACFHKSYVIKTLKRFVHRNYSIKIFFFAFSEKKTMPQIFEAIECKIKIINIIISTM